MHIDNFFKHLKKEKKITKKKLALVINMDYKQFARISKQNKLNLKQISEILDFYNIKKEEFIKNL